MILIVTYDLRSPKDYHDLYEVVKLQGKWWHYMASTWLLSTTKEPQQVVDAMLPYMDATDLLFVCELTPKFQGRLPQQAWDWINTELKPIFPWPFDLPTGKPATVSDYPFAPSTIPTIPEIKSPWTAPTTVPDKADPILPSWLFNPPDKK
jgi:hypothetical protein